MPDPERAEAQIFTGSTVNRLLGYTRVWRGFALTLVLASTAPSTPAANVEVLTLINEEESQHYNLEEAEVSELPLFFGAIKTRSISGGPEIHLLTPEAGTETVKNRPLVQAQSPLTLHLEVQAIAAPVDMDSLAVKVKKFGLSKDLTAMLRDYIEGTSVRATGVAVRKGKYLVVVEVADTQGTRSTAEYILQILP